jgi:hypothetical protein
MIKKRKKLQEKKQKKVMMLWVCRGGNETDLEALAMDDSGAGFVVFLLGDPHLLEGGE